MSLRPFFSYYGSKWRAAPRYPVPRFDTIIEPFAGSAGYSLRYPSRRVVLVDSDPVIARLWRWLIAAQPGEILALPDLEADQRVDDLRICQEARWLIGFWVAKGTTRPRPARSAWMRRGHRPEQYWGPAIRQRLAAQVAFIRHWQVIEGDYTGSPTVTATWFIDPPYQRAGVHYRHGSAGINYKALALWCRGRSGQTMVCEAIGADWLPFELWARIKANESKTGGKVSAEALWQHPPALRLL